MAPQSADIERTERLRYNLGDARPPIPRRESLSTVYAYVKQHRHLYDGCPVSFVRGSMIIYPR